MKQTSPKRSSLYKWSVQPVALTVICAVVLVTLFLPFHLFKPSLAYGDTGQERTFTLEFALDPNQLSNSSIYSQLASFETSLLNGDYKTHLPMISNAPKWNSCIKSSFGTFLIEGWSGDWITPASVLIYANDELKVKGVAGAGAPSDMVRDEWFSRLPGWRRLFMRGTFNQLEPIHETAVRFDMDDMYECIGYAPESAHQAGAEAFDPIFWVPKAEAVAEKHDKCLVYGPAVQDYEDMATPPGGSQPQDELLAALVSQVAPHVDIWVIQLAKPQRWLDNGQDDDGNLFTVDDFRNWVHKWVAWIKGANPNTLVWTQIGIGKLDPIQGVCLPPQSPEYILSYRDILIMSGVDDLWVMPAQPCMPCPPSPPPGLPCSNDPQDHEYYLQSLATFQEAIELACGP